MDNFRLRALWIIDTDTGAILVERRFAALERSHRFGAQLLGISSTDIVSSVLDTISSKATALEQCGVVGNTDQGSHHLLGPFSSPQFVECSHIQLTASKKPARENAQRLGDVGSEEFQDGKISQVGPTVAVGPFVAFSGHRGVRIEVSEPLLRQIAEGLNDNGEDDNGQTQRALIDELLTSFEPHPQYAAAENLLVIAAPLITTRNTHPSANRSSPSLPASEMVEASGELPFRNLLVNVLLSIRSILSPFLENILVIAMESSVLNDEIESATAVVTDLMSGWDDLCGRRVVSDVSWRRAVETFLSVGVSMGRIMSVVSEGQAKHGLPMYSSSHSRTSLLTKRRQVLSHQAPTDDALLLSSQSKSLKAHSIIKAFDAMRAGAEALDIDEVISEGDEDEHDEGSFWSHNTGSHQLEGATNREIDAALNAAATRQVTMYIEQQVAAQCFGAVTNNAYTVTTSVMMAPPAKPRTVSKSHNNNYPQSDSTLLCLLGGVPPPHASNWLTTHNRGGPSHASNIDQDSHIDDGYLKMDHWLITSLAGAPQPIPMTIPMSAAFTQDKKKLSDEGLSTTGVSQAAGLGKFVAAGTWRLPALSPSLPTTASIGQSTANSNRMSSVGAESYPPITAITLASNFVERAIEQGDAVGYSSINNSDPNNAMAQHMIVRGSNNSKRHNTGGGATSVSNYFHQQPKPVLTTVHEIPRSLYTPGQSTSSTPSSYSKSSAFTGSHAFVPVLDPERVRKTLYNTDFGQGICTDATSQEVNSRNKEELSYAREYVESLLSVQGNVLYRIDFDFVLDLGSVTAADIPKLDVVFGITDNATVLHYHLNIYREEGSGSSASAGNATAGAAHNASQRQHISAITTSSLSPMEFLVSFINGGGTKVPNGTSYTIKGIAVCDVSERPTSGALPSFSAMAGKPSVAPNEADILSAVTIYSSASLHFTLLVDRPFLPGSFVLAEPTVMGKCLVDGTAGAADGAYKPVGSTGRSQPIAVTGGAAATTEPSQQSSAEAVLDSLQKKIRAVAFSSKGSGSLLDLHLKSAIRIGLPLTPFPADGDSPSTWRRSELANSSPVSAAVVVRSHAEKGFTFWNYSGDI